MQDYLVKMHKDLKGKGYSNRKLGKMFGISHTTVNKYFTCSSSEFDFLHFVCALRLCEPNSISHRRERIRGIFDSLSPANERLALEVLNMYGEYDLQDELVYRIKNRKLDKATKNLGINKKIAVIYELLKKRLNGEYDNNRYFSEVESLRNSFKSANTEAQIVIGFASVYAHLNFGNYKMVSSYTDQLLPLIKSCSKKTLRHSHDLRSKEMLSMSKQRANELDESRKLCFEIINDELNPYQCMQALAYCTLAETYIKDYKVAKNYLELSLKTLPALTNEKLVKRKEFIDTTMDFLNILHEKDLDKLNPKSEAERAHLYAKTGRKDEAIIILDGIEKKNRNLTAFQKYYRGLATGDKKYFNESAEEFEKTGNFFYSFLPKMHI